MDKDLVKVEFRVSKEVTFVYPIELPRYLLTAWREGSRAAERDLLDILDLSAIDRYWLGEEDLRPSAIEEMEHTL